MLGYDISPKGMWINEWQGQPRVIARTPAITAEKRERVDALLFPDNDAAESIEDTRIERKKTRKVAANWSADDCLALAEMATEIFRATRERGQQPLRYKIEEHLATATENDPALDARTKEGIANHAKPSRCKHGDHGLAQTLKRLFHK